jgi:hypothetical protein
MTCYIKPGNSISEDPSFRYSKVMASPHATVVVLFTVVNQSLRCAMALHAALIELFGKPDFAARCDVIAREKWFQPRKDRVLKDFTVLIRAHRRVVLP